MNILKKSNFDLGLHSLLPEWKKLFSKQHLMSDVNAGITVACVAIPLSLAIALASGVSPGIGLITAVVAGIVCALFGGTPLAVSGPAAAMSILIASTVEKFGLKGLVFICLLIGVMQLMSGVFRLGRLTRFVPLPVISAFISGIGVMIIIGQLPRIFGLSQPDQSHIFGVLTHITQYMHQIKPGTFILVIMTIAMIRILPKFFSKIPATLMAVVIASFVVHIFPFGDIAVIGDIPRTFPTPHWPSFPASTYTELMLTTFTIYILACLETLLSSSAIDKLVKTTKKHNPDQELIGQGLGNIAVAMFGGMPITGVVARSAVNVQSGAKTRRSSIIHSLAILLTVFTAAPLISLIPIAALAGVLISVAFSMINYHEFRNLWKISHGEGLTYLVTFFTIIFVNLIAGVQVGILAACAIILLRMTKTNLQVSSLSQNAIRLSLTGQLIFLSTRKVNELEKNLRHANQKQTIILDLSNLTNLDSSGASAIIDLINNYRERKFNIYIKGLPRRFEALFKICGGNQILEKCSIVSESQLKQNNSKLTNIETSFRSRLIHGVQRFYADIENNNKRLYEHLAFEQDPHTLFVTCADSRIIPSLITSTDPGELFIIRNIGNFIPPYSCNELHSEQAALEFALSVLDIRDIVICGHSDCGAIQACCNKDSNSFSPHLRNWIDKISSQLELHDSKDITILAQQNVLNQIKNLHQYPLIQQRLANKTLTLHAWFFDFKQNLIYEWCSTDFEFKVIGLSAINSATTDIPESLHNRNTTGVKYRERDDSFLSS
jgi:carbonic anhydrase